MKNTTPPAGRRSSALTHELVVGAAIDLLDAEGEGGLTFRALAAALETGHGAIQWHVANKTELLRAATSATVSRAVGTRDSNAAPNEAIRALALNVFDVMDAHPWLGRQLTGSPWQPSMLFLFELIGREIQQICPRRETQFTAASAVLTYIIGAGGRETANAQAPEATGDRLDLLDTMASFWENLNDEDYRFTRTMGEPLRTHDDRDVFLAGVDLIVAGTMHDRAPAAV